VPSQQQKQWKDVSLLATKIAGKLNDEIASGHATTAFTVALLMAAAKDSMDLGYTTFAALIQGIPGVGQGLAVVLAPLKVTIGVLLTLTLQYFLFRKGFLKKVRIRVYFWIFGFFFDNLPLFDALPIQSLMVLVAWRTVKKRAENAEEKLARLKRMTEMEKQELYRDLVLKDGSSLDQAEHTTTGGQPAFRQPTPSSDEHANATAENLSRTTALRHGLNPDEGAKETRRRTQAPGGTAPQVSAPRPATEPQGDIGAQPTFRQNSKE